MTVTGVDDALDDGDVAYTIVTARGDEHRRDLQRRQRRPTSRSRTPTTTRSGITVTPTTGLTTTEAGGTATFTVVLTTQPTADVTIGLSSSDTTEGTVAPASLTFTTANWNVAQTVTVTGVDDALDDGDVAYTIVTAPATSTDVDYNGVERRRRRGHQHATTTRSGITVTPTAGLTTTEAGGTATFTVVLNTQPTADVTIGLSSSDTDRGHGRAGEPDVFTTANWNVAQTVTVTGVDDALDDGDDRLHDRDGAGDERRRDLQRPRRGRRARSPTPTTTSSGITVTPTSRPDDDRSGRHGDVHGGAQPQPTANVTIGAELERHDRRARSLPASLTFTTANWNVAQTVTVTGVDDALDDGDIAYTIVTAPATSADATYNGVDAGRRDGDQHRQRRGGHHGDADSRLTTTEAGGTATFTVVLTTQPTADVTIASELERPDRRHGRRRRA